MPDILTLDEYKSLSGITNTKNDEKYATALPAVTQAILMFTGRDFTTTPPITEEREFYMDESGVIDIDDAVAVTTVKASVPWGTDYTFADDEWWPLPARRDDSSVYWYLAVPGFPYGASPEMGFTLNADVLAREGRWRSKPLSIKVTADWGWPSIPADVKMAAKWTLDDWIARRPETAGAAEAIESFSRNFAGGRLGEAVAWAIPMRSRDLLAGYTKVQI